ncbi:MAG: hypothetical protein FJ304_11740 [Planctomycetes bacterium]|nr:hypothetical protein [Planctomycetota bacterium]
MLADDVAVAWLAAQRCACAHDPPGDPGGGAESDGARRRFYAAGRFLHKALARQAEGDRRARLW